MVCCTIGSGAAAVADIFSTYGFDCREEGAGRAGCDDGLRAGVAARFLEALGRADFLAGLFGRDAFLTLRLAAAFLAGRFFFAADFLAGLAFFFATDFLAFFFAMVGLLGAGTQEEPYHAAREGEMEVNERQK
jgi:hypothetical protein